MDMTEQRQLDRITAGLEAAGIVIGLCAEALAQMAPRAPEAPDV